MGPYIPDLFPDICPVIRKVYYSLGYEIVGTFFENNQYTQDDLLKKSVVDATGALFCIMS